MANLTVSDWEEIRDAAKQGLIDGASARSFTIDGVTYTRPSAEQLMMILDRAEAEIRGSGGRRVLTVVPA